MDDLKAIQPTRFNPLEIAEALKKVMEQSRCNQEELAKKVGKKRSTIANYLRLLNMPPALQASLREGKITMGHAKAILSLDTLDEQMALHNWILQASLSVRQAELAAKGALCANTQDDIFIKALERELSSKWSTRVSIEEKGGKGMIRLHFYSLDDLDRLLEPLR